MRGQQRPIQRRVWVPWAAGLLGGLLAWLTPISAWLTAGAAPSAAADRELANIPLDGQRAYDYLRQICALGPRPSGSEGMVQQRALLTRHFKHLGGQVRLERFRAPHPLTNAPVALANLVCVWHPDTEQRIVLCAHYDTRPLPDRDPDPRRRRHGRFLGANDGASGVAVLMEMAHHMAALKSRYGVDFVLFDAEEFVFDERHPYFLGSQWFAQRYARRRPNHHYRWGVLLDMVGDADLEIFQERFSMDWADTRPLVEQVWATAERLGVRAFVARRKDAVRDDHLNLRNIGKIPTCNIIDFDYPYWHTEGDTPARCSARSLALVGWVVLEWLQTVP